MLRTSIRLSPPTLFAPNTNVNSLRPLLDPLLIENGGRWAVKEAAVEREFQFRNFSKTWDFMTAVALEAKMANHHPEWSNVYNKTTIRWTSHEDKGITERDITLARRCDELAKAFDEVRDKIGDLTVTRIKLNQDKH